MTLKAEDIAALIELFAASKWDELHIEIDGLQLFLSTDPNARLASGAAAASAVQLVAAPQPTAPRSVSAAPTALPAATAAQEVPAHWVPVKAPNLGTFYRAPKPGAPPFVDVGSAVDVNTEICLLEVMKLFTTVKAGVKGIVRRICAQDAELVEGEQVLFYVERT